MNLAVRTFDDALVSLLLKQGLLYGYSPSTVVLGLGGFTRVKDLPRGSFGFFVPDFFLEETGRWIVPEQVLHVTRASVVEALERIMEMSPPVPPLAWTEPDFHSFRRRFMQVQREIKIGRWQKAVPISFERAAGPLSVPHIAQILIGALGAPAPLIPYGYWDMSSGIVGASPELLAAVSEGTLVRVCALAGTATREEGPERLRHDKKELHEHQLVIDYLKERLSTLGEPVVSETVIQELPRLYHLCTPLHVESRRNVDLLELAKMLHPTPALGVTPRHKGWSWLRDMERDSPRGRFGAPFGVQLESGDGQCCVAIRAVQWKGEDVLLGSGCGVVGDSVLEREWNELAAKRESVHRLLGI